MTKMIDVEGTTARVCDLIYEVLFELDRTYYQAEDCPATDWPIEAVLVNICLESTYTRYDADYLDKIMRACPKLVCTDGTVRRRVE